MQLICRAPLPRACKGLFYPAINSGRSVLSRFFACDLHSIAFIVQEWKLQGKGCSGTVHSSPLAASYSHGSRGSQVKNESAGIILLSCENPSFCSNHIPWHHLLTTIDSKYLAGEPGEGKALPCVVGGAQLLTVTQESHRTLASAADVLSAFNSPHWEGKGKMMRGVKFKFLHCMAHSQLSSTMGAPYFEHTWPLCISTFIHLFLEARWWLEETPLSLTYSATYIQRSGNSWPAAKIRACRLLLIIYSCQPPLTGVKQQKQKKIHSVLK